MSCKQRNMDLILSMIHRLICILDSPGKRVSTEVCDLQGSAELNALGDLRNVFRRKEKVEEAVSSTDTWMEAYFTKTIILSSL